MKNNRLKLFILVLVIFSFTFLASFGETKAIYREVKSTSLNLTVISGSDYVVNFVTNGGTSIPSRSVAPNTAVGVLPIPTKTGENFAGWYDANNQRVTHQTVITANTTLTARWTKIVCKRVTDSTKLHTETCLSGGCRVNNNAGLAVNDIITYGAVGDGVPLSGDAYDCDVNYDGIFDATESDNKTYTERFYFVREKTNTNAENNAVLVYSTSFDEHGRDDRVTDKSDGSYHYTLAESYLPASTPTQSNSNAWDNPLLVDFDGNGKVSRFSSMTDLESVCGPVTFSNGNSGTSYFASCQKWFWFENSRFQNANKGRAGIWMEYETGDTKYHRIHTQSFDVMEVEESSENMARPVIEIQMSALEGYYDEDRFTLSFNTYTNDPNPIESVKRYRGEAIGTLPTPTREGYTFDNWYTDNGYQNVVDPTALVSGNMTLYANWEAEDEVTITLHLNDGEITGVTSPITINSGETLSTLPDPTRTGYIFGGWYTDSGFNNLFDKTQPITTDLDLYAKWNQTVTVTVTLYLDGGSITDVTSPITLNYGDLLDNLPDPTKADNTFKGWYTDSGFNTPFDDTEPITSNISLYAKWQPEDAVAEINGTYFTTLDDAFDSITDNTPTTITILKDITLTEMIVIPSNRNIELDIGSYTISSGSCNLFENSGTLDIINGTITYTGNTGNSYVFSNKASGVLNVKGGTISSTRSGTTIKNTIINAGIINITGGSITNASQGAVINNNKARNATINMSGGEVIGTDNTGKSQAIYNTGVLNISGDAYLESSSKGSNARATVHNATENSNNGTLTITGGTIVSHNFAAVKSDVGTTTIGINDNNGNIIDTTSPVLIGATYALQQAGGTLSVYDGVFKTSSSTATEAYTGTITIPSGTEWDNSTREQTYLVSYLKNSSGGPYSVIFDPYNDGINTQTISNISSMAALGSSMPNNPTRTNYVFEKWYISVNEAGTFTSSTPIVNDITVLAKWKPSIGSATISPASILMSINDTETITVTGPSDMEGYTFISNDASVATVDSNGVVTGVAGGSTTIIIRGNDSLEERTVNVTVSNTSLCTVIFNTNGGAIIPSETIECNSSLGNKMPINPEKTNYLFDNWTINGTNTTFTSTTPVTENIAVNANWTPSVALATVGPSSMSLRVSETGTISITNIPSGMETYTVSSDDTSVATVNGLVVTGVDVGDATISVTGNRSGYAHTISVSVASSQCTVTFNTNGGSLIPSETIDCGSSLGIKMPNNPERADYIFDNWTVNGTNTTFTSTTPVTDDITVNANWTPSVSLATVSPSSMSLLVSETGTISITDIPTGMEAYTIASSDTSVATVNGLVVTGAGAGNTTVTVTGNRSGYAHTISVSVTVPQCTVTFNTNGGALVPSETVDCDSSLGNKMPNNPERTDYIFDNWTVNGTNTTFTSTTPVTNDITVNANWTPSVSLATVSPSSMNIGLQNTNTISMTDIPTGMEAYTIASSNTSIATVNGFVVTGVGAGNTTVTVTGNRSGYVHTINVTVAPVSAYEVTFDPDNGETPTIENVVVGDSLENYIPTNPTNTNYVFDDWYLYDTVNDTLTTTIIDPNEVITGDRTYKAKWAPSGTVCKLNGTYYSTLQDAADAIDINETNTIYLLADVTDSRTTKDSCVIDLYADSKFVGADIVLDLQGHSITYNGAQKVYVIRTKAFVEIKNGTITTNSAGNAAINIESGGGLVMHSGSVNAIGDRHAIYNDGGNVLIDGTAHFSSKATGAFSNVARGTVTNVSGTMQINGGTIENSGGCAISMGVGSLTIGVDDGNIDTTSLVATGGTYGLEIKSGSTVRVNDGLFKGKTKGINDITRTTHPNGANYDTDDEEGQYKLAYLVGSGATPTPTPTPTATPTPTPTPTPVPSTNTITFESMGGTISPATADIVSGEPVTNADLPTTTTWGNKTFAGWYLDEDYTEAVVTGTTTPTDDVTYYAKWTYTGSMTNYDSTNDALSTYFSNISSWKNLSESDFKTQMSNNFTTNNCSACEAENTCNNPGSGNHCDKPKVYDTNTSSALDVYLYDESSNTILKKIEYANSSNGTITNLIPGQAYYWEKASDPTVNGLIKATTPRRALSVGNIRNVRDLGGLAVSYMENNVSKTGTIKYGKLLRGAKLSSSQSDVTALTNLGITREIDLRPNSEGSGQARMDLYDNGSGGTDINIQNYLINHTAYTYSYSHSGTNYTEVAERSSNAATFKAALKSVMQYIVNGDNIYFHCTIGTDRTGTMAYFLEGLLGVSEEDRVRDYELSYYFGLVVDLGARTRYHDDLLSTNTYPRFKFMHTAYPTNQDIYAWFTYGDNATQLEEDNALITAFRNAMIDFD